MVDLVLGKVVLVAFDGDPCFKAGGAGIVVWLISDEYQLPCSVL